MESLNLKDYLFRVYTKFKIVDLSMNDNLKQHLNQIQKYNLKDLVKLLVFGYIDPQRHNPDLIKKDFLGLLYDSDGKSSPLALGLLEGTDLYKVDLGHLLTGETNTKYKVSLSTFILILMFYRSKHYKNISSNMKLAILTFLDYTNKNNYLSYRFPEIEEDKRILQELLKVVSKPEYEDKIRPSLFRDVIQGIGERVQNHVANWDSSENVDSFTAYIKGLFRDSDEPTKLKDLIEAMFELFKAGYYPASISSVLPDTILATLPNREVYGQLDYFMLLDKNHCPHTDEVIIGEGNIVRIVFQGSYADKSILFEHQSRWTHIEERFPGAWRLFRIIYNRLAEGEYNTDRYNFSQYSLVVNEEDEDLKKAARVRWLTLFSSFILGHVINLIGTSDAQQLYKVAAPVIKPRDDNYYLVPENFHVLERPIIYYEIDDNRKMIMPRYYGEFKWLKYQADKVYTPTSASVSDVASYTSSYAILVSSEQVTDVKIDSYGGTVEDWNEVVLAETGSQSGLATKRTDKLVFKLYDEQGQEVNIALSATSADPQADDIEPGKVKLSKEKLS